jgi:structural maintenance of chromosome 2
MRPQEILGMVEEAAGTRMFEEQKDKAKKKMGKKEKSVLEYKATLQEEINPKLEKLRNEKRSFIQFQKSVSELERTARILHALEWTTYRDRMHEKQEEIEAKQKDIKRVESEKKQAIKDGEAAEKEIVKVSKKRDAEMSKGGKLKQLQDEASALGKVVAKIRTQAEIKVATIKDEEAKIKTYEARLKEVRFTSLYLYKLLTTILAGCLPDRKTQRGRESCCSTPESQRRTYRLGN